jgi:aryl-alcohol dehydrogenase-like predicted oxidoreductase
MTPRPLGNSGLAVPPLVFGTNIFGWTVDQETSFQLLDRLLVSGFNFLDTADIYSKWVPGHTGGESETIIGHWMQQRHNRDRILVATKCGMEISPTEKGLSKAYILRAAERSLQRLQSDNLDLYQAHKDDESTPLEETLSAFAQLIKQGKVRVIGASNYTAPRLAQALEISRQNSLPRYECLQPHYNLAQRADYEKELEPLCLKEKLGVIPYFSLASGFLTGKYRSEADLAQSPRGKSVKQYMNDRGQRILAALDRVSEKLHATPARVAIAWLIARPSVTAPIASATSPAQLDDLVAATKLQLDDESVIALNDASAWQP